MSIARWRRIREGIAGLHYAPLRRLRLGRPVGPPPPGVRDTSRVRTAVDRFIEAALEKAGLTLGPEAPREALVRRVSFALSGLPPSPDEIAAFLSDPARAEAR